MPGHWDLNACLGLQVTWQRIIHFERPFISPRRRNPSEIGLSGNLIIAAIGEQRGDIPKGLDLGAQPRQNRFFFPQYFVNIFHSRRAPAQGLLRSEIIFACMRCV